MLVTLFRTLIFFQINDYNFTIGFFCGLIHPNQSIISAAVIDGINAEFFCGIIAFQNTFAGITEVGVKVEIRDYGKE